MHIDVFLKFRTTKMNYVNRDNMGINVRVKVVKNKVAPPFKSIDMDILFGSGIDQIGCLVDAAESVGVLVRKGSWYYYGNSTYTSSFGFCQF